MNGSRCSRAATCMYPRGLTPVAFEFDDEIKLWQNLETMLIQPEIIKQLIERRKAGLG